MILEHEIPDGSKLYFGNIAKRKREMENIASNIFYKHNFQEMLTPIFSYHQINSLPTQNLIHLSDKNNYPMNLRADSTVDVAKLMLKRIGRNSDNSRWFYIQPVYQYPSIEQYQIGAENIGNTNLQEILNINIEIFKSLDFTPILQISNIAIPKKIVEELDISIELFKNIEIRKILNLEIDWLKDLLYLENVEDISKVRKKAPNFLQNELEKLENLAKSTQYPRIRIAPLYYTKMDYYNNLLFKFAETNRVFSRGGNYSVDNFESVGFAIYTDEVLSDLH